MSQSGDNSLVQPFLSDKDGERSVVWLNAQKGPDGLPIPIISVIVVTYYTGPSLEKCIDSVLKQDFPVELILVDNGNPLEVTGDMEELSRSERDIHLRTGHGNIGFARGCNLGAKAASGHYLLFLNPDTELPDDALEVFFTESLALKRPWLLGPRLINEDGTEQRGARREVLTPWSAFVEGTKLYKLMPNHPSFERFNRVDREMPDKTISTPVISGACMLLPKDDYWAIGGMDEGYFLHVEDVDFCYRFRFQGGMTYFMPQIQVVHHKSTSEASSIFVEWCKARGFVRYFSKNFRDFYPRIFLYMVNGGVMAFYCVKFCKIALGNLLSIFRRQ